MDHVSEIKQSYLILSYHKAKTYYFKLMLASCETQAFEQYILPNSTKVCA